MKYLLIFIPFLSFGQNNLIKKITISQFNINDDKFIDVRKSILIYDDTILLAEKYERTVLTPNDPNAFNVLGDYDEYFNLAIEAWKDIPDTLGTYNTNEVTDSAQYIGNWRLNIKGQITNGKLKINANDKFIFDPNLNQPRTTNLPLVIKSNLIKIVVDGVKYLLIKNESGKYISNDNTVRFVKLE
jgi:hypothetical protein